MITYLLLVLTLAAFPKIGFAQFIDKGDNVEVEQGTKLCLNSKMEKEKGSIDPGRIFWKVKSKMRSNGTQTVATFVRERIYDPKSGDTRVEERLYQESYATFFKRDPQHHGMLAMMSPRDGRIEAVVEVCEKRK